jgi:hypothetical protein
MDIKHSLLGFALAGAGLLGTADAVAFSPASDRSAEVLGQLGSTELAPEVQAFISEKLAPLMTNKVFVAEVTKQNALARSLSEIQQICAEWSAAESEMPIMREMLTNATANELRSVLKDLPQVGEVFVMDNQGANVGQNGLTSDFWQGDEAKWKKSFNEGKGGIDVGKASLDKSTNEVLQQVSLPIINEKGEVIGAVCIGLRINQF